METKYQIRYGAGSDRQSETFESAEDTAKFWQSLNDPTSTLFVIDEDHGFWPGTYQQVKPVYDAMKA